MEYAVAMHVVHSLDQLVHVALNPCLRQILPPPTDKLVDIHIHELEDKCQPTCRLLVEHLDQLRG